MYRGSRKHVLDWTDRPAFLGELRDLLPDVPLEIEGEVYRTSASPRSPWRQSTPSLSLVYGPMRYCRKTEEVV